MTLDEILQDFLSLTQDAVAVGYRSPDESTARLVYVNEGFITLFGSTEDEVLGEPASILHHPDHWEDFTAAIAGYLESGTPRFQAEAYCRKANGQTFWASLSIILCEHDEFGGRHSVGIYRDMSDLKKREEDANSALRERDRLLTEKEATFNELLATQSRLVSAMDAHPDPFVIYDKNMRLVICNTAYRSGMSRDPDAIKPGMHVGDVLHIAIDSGVIPEPTQGRELYISDIVENAYRGARVEDLELDNDTHHRVIRSFAENGDFVSLRLDITEMVRQRRVSEEAQTRLLQVISAYPDPFVIYDKDRRLVVCNDAYRKSMSNDPARIQPGMQFREVLLCAIEDGIVPEPAEGIDAHIESVVSNTRTMDLQFGDDSHYRVIRSVSENGDILSLRIDVTELVRQRRAAVEAQSRLVSAINAYPGPFCIYDADYRLVMYNEQYARGMTNDLSEVRAGMTLEEVVRVGLRNGFFADAIGNEEEWLANLMSSVETTRPVEDLHLVDDTHHRLFRSRSQDGDLIMIRIDITEQVRQSRALAQYAKRLEDANTEITYKALHDELTGLGNRRHLTEKFRELSRRRELEGGELSALHIDLDRFKQINDTIGHAAGDHVLKEMANRVRSHAHPDDSVSRIGGDEFVILIWEREPSDRPIELARTLIREGLKPSFYKGRECRFGASIGLARTPLADVEGLLTYSDIALYKAKRAGRGQVGIFDAQDVEDMRQTKAMADDILRGLEQLEFVPYFQPQIDARTGAVVGVEALARWHHPEKGVLAPNVFLPVAGELNVVSEIDRMMFEKAIIECEAIFAGRDPFPSLSFNVSAKRINDANFDDIARFVAGYSGEVAFELLETIFLEEEDDGFLMQLDRLRELGISIEVDDFGSGRASIVALQRIAPERLKIDGRLVRPIVESNNAGRLVQSIIEIANALNIGIVAEGVETAEHALILAELGADRLQGYHFARPMPSSDLRAFLSNLNGDRFSDLGFGI